MDERAAFESWVKSRGGDVMKRNGQYLSSMTRLWHECWQARAAIAQPVADKLAEALRGVMANIAITGDYAKFESARAALAEYDRKKGE